MCTSNMSNPPKKTNSFNAPGFLHRKFPVGFWPIFSGQLQLASPKACPLVSGTPGYTPHGKRWVHQKKQASKYGPKIQGVLNKNIIVPKKNTRNLTCFPGKGGIRGAQAPLDSQNENIIFVHLDPNRSKFRLGRDVFVDSHPHGFEGPKPRMLVECMV